MSLIVLLNILTPREEPAHPIALKRISAYYQGGKAITQTAHHTKS